MPIILKRPRAADDLIELWDYIADDNVARADAFIDDVDAKLNLLANNPCSAAAVRNWLRAYEAFRLGDM